MRTLEITETNAVAGGTFLKLFLGISLFSRGKSYCPPAPPKHVPAPKHKKC